MKRPLAAILLGSLAFSTVLSTAWATTYVRVEKDGTKTYSDRPIPGGQPIEIQAAQTYSASPPPPRADSGVPLEQRLLGEMDTFKYESCSVKPDRDQTFMNPESVPIAITTKPVLRPGDVVDMRVDGTTVGDATTTSFLMKPAFRGTHTVTVVVKDRFGRSLCNTSSSFHVHQPNLNSPTRKPPPKPPKPKT